MVVDSSAVCNCALVVAPMICEVMKEKGLISSYKIEESVSTLISDGVTRPENATLDCNKIKTLFDLRDKTLKNCIEEVIDYLV